MLDYLFFFFNDTATTEIYTLSLHDALPICITAPASKGGAVVRFLSVDRIDLRENVYDFARQSVITRDNVVTEINAVLDRKSTRLNSSHANISYAVFCLKKKNLTHNTQYHLF